MLVIRLARIGRSRRAAFRVVVQEKTKAPKSDALEIIGTYDPLAKENNWKFDIERVKYYLSKGAQPSATIHNQLVRMEVIAGAKRKVVGTKKGVLAKAKADIEAASKAAAEAKKNEAAKVAEVAAAPASEATQAPEAPKTETPDATPTEQK